MPKIAESEARRLRIFEQSAQQQIRDVKQPQDECGGEARVPGPPDAPDRAWPTSGPVISPIVQQTTPTSAAATPSQSHLMRLRVEVGDVRDEDEGKAVKDVIQAERWK